MIESVCAVDETEWWNRARLSRCNHNFTLVVYGCVVAAIPVRLLMRRLIYDVNRQRLEWNRAFFHLSHRNGILRMDDNIRKIA